MCFIHVFCPDGIVAVPARYAHLFEFHAGLYADYNTVSPLSLTNAFVVAQFPRERIAHGECAIRNLIRLGVNDAVAMRLVGRMLAPETMREQTKVK